MPPVADPLNEILRPAQRTAVVDIGANPLGGNPPYKPLLELGLCDLVGFEPQPEALAKLQTQAGPHEHYLPDAVGDGGNHTLHICAGDGLSSLLVPEPQRLALFARFPEWGTVTGTLPVQTRRLDDIAEIAALDFLKMDVQGGELAVLTHGKAKLARAVAIQVELSFFPLYADQPTLGDVDRELRLQGFLPHGFAGANIWPLTPATRPTRQIVDADLVYVRDITRAENMDGEQWKHLALIAHHCYGSYDLAMRAVMMAAHLGATPPDAPSRYAATFPRKPD